MSTSLKFDHTESSDVGEQLVIQCPSCATRFGIERTLVEAISSPRFHCSKCDHLFGLDPLGVDKSGSARTHRKAATTPAAGNDSAEYNQPALRSVSRSSSDTLGSGAGVSTEAGVAEGVVAVYRNQSRVEPTIHRKTEKTPALEIPKRWDGTVRTLEPRETAASRQTGDSSQHTPDLSDASQMAFDFASASTELLTTAGSSRLSATPKGETIQVPAFGAVLNAPLTDTHGSVSSGQADYDYENVSYDSDYPAGGYASFGAVEGNLAFISPAASARDAVVTSKKGSGLQLSPLRPAQRSSLGRTLVLPIVGFLALLVVASIALRQSPALSSKFISTAIPGALEAAPSELYIKSTRFQKVALDNGEVIRVISGTIVNSSQRNFHKIKIEAAVFNGAGKPIGTARADAASTLAKTKIQSLTSEMIEQLQTGAASRHLIIRPGEKRDFSVALVGEEYAAAQHFAARIHSAKSF